jgi:hypothetical protein
MCWIGYTLDKRRAMHDIKAYKVLYVYKLDENVLMSPRQEFKYAIGQTYNARITPQAINGARLGFIRITYGLHCYSENCTFTRYEGDPHDPKIRRYCSIYARLTHYQDDIETGALHTFRKKDYYFPVVFECTIPKGTTYYENKAGEIVTEALTIDKITEL